MNRRHLVFLVAAALCLPAVTRVNARELSLEAALQLASAHSYAVKQARSDEEAAQAAFRAARAERLPTLAASAVAFYNSDVSSLSLDLPGFSLNREIGTKDHYQTDIRLSVPVFTGGRLSSGIDVAAAGRDYRRALAEASAEQVLLAARVAYLRLAQATDLVASAGSALKRTQITVDDIRSMYAAGVADSTDLLEAQLALTSAQFSLDDATTARRSAEISLLNLLGLPPEETLDVTTVLPDPSDPSDLTVSVSSAKPQLAAADAAMTLSGGQMRLAKADYLPTLSVYGGCVYGKPNIDLFNSSWNDYFTVGTNLTWSFNLGNRTGSRARQAQANYTAAEHNRASVGEALDREARLARQQLQLAFDRSRTAEVRHEITSANYRLARGRHQAGALSSNRLVEIEASLNEAEAARAAARADYFVARAQYLYAVGSENLGKGISE